MGLRYFGKLCVKILITYIYWYMLLGFRAPKTVLKENRYNLMICNYMVFHKIKAALHTVKVTSEMIVGLGWENVQRPYISDYFMSD